MALTRMVSGLVLWAAAFSILYALHGFGCSLGWTGPSLFGVTQVKVLLLAVWGILIVTHGLLMLWLLKQHETQMERIGIAIGCIGLGATISTGMPILAIPSCV
ncbi:hypothetical protein [Croceicoccus marinus]|nr:hypothetical protein [Croceicoccus marinus]